MEYLAFKDLVIAKAQEMGLAEYEIYYQSNSGIIANAFGDEIDQFSANSDGGVCFRCIVKGKMGYASTEELSPEQAASIVEKAMDNASVLEAEEPVFLVSGGQAYTPIQRENPSIPLAQNLVQRVLQVQGMLYATDPAVTEGSITRGIGLQGRIAICNSKGLDLDREYTMNAIMVGAVVTDGTDKANDYQLELGDIAQIDAQALTRKATGIALSKLGGEPAPTGVYPVVFDPEAMSDLLDTFSGIFDGEAAQKGLSKLKGQEGNTIASDVVTVIDDPFHPENPMSMSFDAEGSPTYRKNVIEKGVLKTLLHNLQSANMAGVATTGNAYKGKYDSPVGINPFTMHIAPGEWTEEQLLEKAGNGVYIRSLSGLHAGANAITGDFSLQSEGYMIENGQKTTHVNGFTVAGNFYDLLKNITAVANNLTIPSPASITTYGSPSVLVENLSVAGK